MAVLVGLVISWALSVMVYHFLLRDPTAPARVFLSRAFAWTVSPVGVLSFSVMWLLLTHWGHTVPVVSWGSLLVLLGLSTLLRAAFSLLSVVVLRVRGNVTLPALARSGARVIPAHRQAAKAFLDKLREGDEVAE